MDRTYGTWEEMAEHEATRGDGIEAVTICTPNDSHHAIASALLDHGVDVICDKPLTTVDDALDLVRRQRDTGLVFAVTYNYTGYVMVRHARELLASGELGAVRLVQVEFASGWAATLLEASGHRQRSDPGVAAPDLRTVADGARGVLFVDAVARSHRRDSASVDVPADVDGATWSADA